MKREKLLEKVRKNTKNVSFGDLQTLLENYGVELKRVRGSHHVFSGLIGDQRVRLVVPLRRPFVKEAYVKEAIGMIDAIRQLREGDSDQTNKPLDYYLSLSYPILLVHDQANSTWYAKIPLLPGCMSDGESPDEAIQNVSEARIAWLEVALEENDTIPEPEPIDVLLSNFDQKHAA